MHTGYMKIHQGDGVISGAGNFWLGKIKVPETLILWLFSIRLWTNLVGIQPMNMF